MEHEYDQNRKHARAANTRHHDSVEPGQSSRSTQLRRPEQPIASGLVQRRANAAGEAEPSAVHAAAARGVGTISSQLPYLGTIQRAFGRHNISSVQAHTGPEADVSARAMGARAYATGNHVVLGDGADLHTVAHEAAHVVQQRGGVQLKGGVGEVGDPYERHADAVADLVVQGKSSEALLDEMAGIHAAGNIGAGVVQRSPFRPTPEPGMPVWLKDPISHALVERTVESYNPSTKMVKLRDVDDLVPEDALKYSRPLEQNHIADQSSNENWLARPNPKPRSRYSFAPLVENKMIVTLTMQKSQAAGHSHIVFEWWDPYQQTSHHHVFEFSPKQAAENQEHTLLDKTKGVPGQVHENEDRNYLPNHKDGKPIDTWFRSWEVPYKAGDQGLRSARGLQELAQTDAVTYELLGGDPKMLSYNCHTMAKKLAEDAGVNVDAGILDALFKTIPAAFSGYPIDGTEHQMAQERAKEISQQNPSGQDDDEMSHYLSQSYLWI